MVLADLPASARTDAQAVGRHAVVCGGTWVFRGATSPTPCYRAKDANKVRVDGGEWFRFPAAACRLAAGAGLGGRRRSRATQRVRLAIEAFLERGADPASAVVESTRRARAAVGVRSRERMSSMLAFHTPSL